MQTNRVIEILQQEKKFFVDAATRNKEEETRARIRSLKQFYKGKSQTYSICADCIQDVIDLIIGIEALETEYEPKVEENK